MVPYQKKVIERYSNWAEIFQLALKNHIRRTNLLVIMEDYFGDQYCPFCDNETDLTLKEHGKICPEYKETVKDNICPFCATKIDECYIEHHDKYR